MMKNPDKHKWLLIYTNPGGWSYYRYGRTIKELKEWAEDRDGSFNLYSLKYSKNKSWTHGQVSWFNGDKK